MVALSVSGRVASAAMLEFKPLSGKRKLTESWIDPLARAGNRQRAYFKKRGVRYERPCYLKKGWWS
jgi:hypothetical protein